jgi:hypothetical protein
MTIHLKGSGMKRSWLNFKVSSGIHLKGVRKTTKNSIRIAGRRGRESNPGPPNYEAVVLTTPRQRSVVHSE